MEYRRHGCILFKMVLTSPIPKLSITLPTYNGQQYISSAIDNILGQSFSDFELVIVIDGSTDSTEQILGQHTDSRIRVIKKKRNKGLPSALNTGLAASVGEYWCWTSDDNLYMPGALETMVNYLDSHPEANIVSPWIYHVRPDESIMYLSRRDYNCFMCRRHAAVDIGGYRDEFMLVEDADFFTRFRNKYGKIRRIRKPLYKFRDHPSSLSSRQLVQRQLVSVKMHYDLISRGIENGSLKELFYDRLSVSARWKGYQVMDEIVHFAIVKDLPFARRIERKTRFYHTKAGWILARFEVAVLRRIRIGFRSFLENVLDLLSSIMDSTKKLSK